MTRIPRAVIFAVALAIVASVVGGGIVFAKGSDSNASTPAVTASLVQQDAADYIAKLAANLGVDPQKLKDAVTKTNLDVLAQAVADGKLTQAQADKIKAQLESGDGFFFGGHGPGGPGGPGRGGAPGLRPNLGSGVETFLGITADQLKSELQSGKSLAEVAVAHGKTRDDLKQYLVSQETAAIDKAVADGKLTKDVADRLKANLAARIDQMIDMKPGSGRPSERPGHPKGAGTGGGTRQGQGLLPPALQ